MKTQNGITLIALVITIIVLLILAGVSISMVTGENGVLTRADRAKDETIIAQEKEQVSLGFTAVKTDLERTGCGRVESEDSFGVTVLDWELEDEINNANGGDIVSVNEDSDGNLVVTFAETGHSYKVTQSGKVETTLNINLALSTARKPSSQTETDDVGISEDGTVVDLDLWMYTYLSNNKFALGEGDGSISSSGYSNSDITSDGKIQGKIPTYIKDADTGTVYTLTNMEGTFYNCSNLKEAPEIPSTVTNMDDTFYGCTVLTKAPKIPSKVECMNRCFFSCASLTGTVEINANPTSYIQCFYNAAMATTSEVVLTGSSDILQELCDTQSVDSKISVEN